jgi:hypothetical protein
MFLGDIGAKIKPARRVRGLGLLQRPRLAAPEDAIFRQKIVMYAECHHFVRGVMSKVIVRKFRIILKPKITTLRIETSPLIETTLSKFARWYIDQK